jgi:hypothetical protein
MIKAIEYMVDALLNFWPWRPRPLKDLDEAKSRDADIKRRAELARLDVERQIRIIKREKVRAGE